MTNNKKLLLGIGAGVLIYWAWSRNKAGKSLNPFAKSSSFSGDDNFFNFARGCKTYQGNAGYVGMIITSWEAGGSGEIVSTGHGQTIVCPTGQTRNVHSR